MAGVFSAGILLAAMQATQMVATKPEQRACPNGIRIEGTIADPTGALIPGAHVESAAGESTDAGADGRYVLLCVAPVPADITAQATGFGSASSKASGPLGTTVYLDLTLAMAVVQTNVQVEAEAPGLDSDAAGGGNELSQADVARLPDDPDDLLRELQTLAGDAGGDPSATAIVVDGFQNGSAMPPKSSIASVRVSPDSFSAERQNPDWNGGRIEITTKPGSESWHGALIFTGSNSVFNATDPFVLTATPSGKRRYGFEFAGPVIPKRSGFSMALEKRDIDEFNVVNAITLAANGMQTPLREAVAAPQRRWIGSARADTQFSTKDIATLSFSANVKNLANQGVGGLVLPEAGYSSLTSEYDLHFTNIETITANLLHQARVGLSWKRTEQAPASTAPGVQVAGFFTGGGAAAFAKSIAKDGKRDRSCSRPEQSCA